VDTTTAISVIIPALDEEPSVAAAIASARQHAEVIVVDGGSSDGTAQAAASLGASVVHSSRGRGRQLAAGAAEARGDWLVFLHADTRLAPGWADELRCQPPHVVGGAFRFAMDTRRFAGRVMEFGVWLRCRLFRLPYGDQAIFARRSAYLRSGGFPDLPLLEDVVFVRRLRRVGAVRMLRTRALTSARRWEQRGMFRTMLLNWLIMALHGVGVPPQRLARLYAGSGSKPPRPSPWRERCTWK
jgi:hypothetical protein